MIDLVQLECRYLNIHESIPNYCDSFVFFSTKSKHHCNLKYKTLIDAINIKNYWYDEVIILQVKMVNVLKYQMYWNEDLNDILA